MNGTWLDPIALTTP